MNQIGPTSFRGSRPIHHSIRYFTDATGAMILENEEGRFRLDKSTGKYVRDA